MYTPVGKFGSRHSLRDAPAMIGPSDAPGVDGGAVVVVVGGAVVVVGGVVADDVVGGVVDDDAVVVVVGGVLPPLSLPPLIAVGAVVVVVEVEGVALIGLWRLMTPENSRLPVSFASFMRIAVLNEFEFRPTKAEDAEASIVTIDTSRLVATPSVTNLGNRCAVFAKRNFLSAPVYME